MTGSLSDHRIRFFGTYDDQRHPRIAVLREGLRGLTHVDETNVPVDIDTAMRVDALQSPFRLLAVVPRLLRAWWRLVVLSRHGSRPNVVVVGHLGHLDVVLAKLLFPRARICLDYLISVADTARDRGLGGTGLRSVPLRALDWIATRVADEVIVDTTESIETIPPSHRHKAVVVPVGADHSWFDTEPKPPPIRIEPLRVVFYGLFTPLQGTPVIGAALRQLADRGVPIDATLIGDGQDRDATRKELGPVVVRWLDWVDGTQLPQLVADHDVCLGIFGTGPKARRVVPNKAYQGASAGCAVVTSDTPPQRRMLSDACLFVPAGDPSALADALVSLCDQEQLRSRRHETRDHAQLHFTPTAVARVFADHLTAVLDREGRTHGR